MKIAVLYDIDTVGKVNAVDLRRLIADGKIVGFRRTSGWVMLGRDAVRGDGGTYAGPERRNIRQKPSPSPERGMHVCVLPGTDEPKDH